MQSQWWLNMMPVSRWNQHKKYCSLNRVTKYSYFDIDGLVQDCSNSKANALELLQSCTQPLISWSICEANWSRGINRCAEGGWARCFINIFMIFSCDQAAIWLVHSVCPSVRLSVCLFVCPPVTPFSPCSHHRIIMKFSGVTTMVRSYVHAKGHGQRSKVNVTEVNTQLSRFRTLAPVWIHIWQWNHAHNWKQHRRGALLFFKVIRQISRSHGSKNRRIWPRLGVSGL